MTEFANAHPFETVIIVLALFALVGRIVPWMRRPPDQDSEG
jgi:hypothetical protein